MSRGALSHIAVLDLTQHIAGPYATKFLADYGANILKVERPGKGDSSRRLGPFPNDVPDSEASGTFIYLNGNKKSVTINLETHGGQEIVRELMRWATLVVTGHSPASLERLHLTHRDIAKANPRAACLSITNFGLTGPYRDYKADHMTLSAMAGWAQYLGHKDRQPLQPGMNLSLLVAGVQAASAAIAACEMTRQTGRSQSVDLSIMETINQMLPGSMLRYSMTGAVETRGMYPFPSQGILQCKDGYVGLNSLTERHWELMCGWLGMEDVLADPRFATGPGRWEHSAYLRQRAEAYFATRTKQELFHEGQGWQVATGLVSTPKDALESEQLAARDYYVTTRHPKMGDALQPGAPIGLTRSPWALRTPAPRLGQHNEEVFCGMLGLSRGELSLLREQRDI